MFASPSTSSSTPPPPAWAPRRQSSRRPRSARPRSPTTWSTSGTPPSCGWHATRVRGAPTASACSSSRRPSPSSFGAGCARRRGACSPACVATRRLRWVVIAWKAFSYTLGALVIAFVFAQLWFYGHILYWSRYNPSSTAFMDRSLQVLQEKDLEAHLRRQWVPYERISGNLKRAVVAAEDARFLDHEGFDWEMIQKAMVRNEKRGRVVAGASTISQQLAKNLFLSGERSWLRKGQEAIITWMLEDVLSKRRILELYLNLAEWGDGVFGAEAAARQHFGVSAAALSPEQAAWLAVVLPSPRRYERGRLTPYLAGRVNTILGRMGSVQIP